MTIEDPLQRFQRAARPEDVPEREIDDSEHADSLGQATPPGDDELDQPEPELPEAPPEWSMPTDQTVHAGLNLPQSFWRSRPVFAHIRQAAHARGGSADAVLGNIIARVAALTPPTYCLPAIVGATAPLSVFIAALGPPGTGKSSAKKTAMDLLPYRGNAVADDLPLGSGEGLIEAYFDLVEEANPAGKGANIKVKRHTRYGAFVFLDEGQVMAELGSRKGSTLLPMLRTAWSGSTLGTTNASIETRRRLQGGTYAIGLVAAFQPAMAADLLADEAGGTPQRFEWCHVLDPSIPDRAPEWPGPLDWTPPEIRSYSGTQFESTLSVDADVAAEIRRTAIQRTRGQLEVANLDAHGDLARLKVAGVFCILDGRYHISNDDWILAGIYRDTSVAVRTWVVNTISITREHAELGAIRRHVSREVAVADTVLSKTVDRMARSIANHVHKNGADGKCSPCTKACATRSTASRDRSRAPLEDAIEYAVREHWITTVDEKFYPGNARPA